MLPFDNKNELLLVLDFDRGTTLERSDAGVREIEAYLAKVPEVADYDYVGLGSPMDFNGLVPSISGKAITWRTYGSIWRTSTAACRATRSAYGCGMTSRKLPTGTRRA